MWRTRAVRSLLVEDVAGLRAEPEGEPAATLARARRRAILVVCLDWLALVVLFLLRDRELPFLPLGATPEAVFTFGVLAVATHAGFRLGQYEKYRAVANACSELAERDAEGS